MRAKMVAAGVAPADIGLPKHPNEWHDKLWALLFEVHPERRQRYEEAKEEARQAFEQLGPEDVEVDEPELIPHEEVYRRMFGHEPPAE